MATTPEGKVKAEVKAILRELDIYFVMPAANGYGRAGIPDFLCCLSGGFLAIECKANGNSVTALQERELRAISQAGGLALVVTDEDVFKLKSFLQTFRSSCENEPRLVH